MKAKVYLNGKLHKTYSSNKVAFAAFERAARFGNALYISSYGFERPYFMAYVDGYPSRLRRDVSLSDYFALCKEVK